MVLLLLCYYRLQFTPPLVRLMLFKLVFPEQVIDIKTDLLKSHKVEQTSLFYYIRHCALDLCGAQREPRVLTYHIKQ